MLAHDDDRTFEALLELCSIRKRGQRRIAVWVGAGAAKWRGLPLWEELARAVLKSFRRLRSEFDYGASQQLLREQRFPELFSVLQRVDRLQYRKSLLEHLATPPQENETYKRFIRSLVALLPMPFITTNVDQGLEQAIGCDSLAPGSLDRWDSIVESGRSCVAKIHGSIETPDSLVFTQEQYESLAHDRMLHSLLSHVFERYSVVFVGYGLRDSYILKALRRAREARPNLGSGPHFAISDAEIDIDSSVRSIRIEPHPHKDYRSAIQVFEELSAGNLDVLLELPQGRADPSQFESVHVVADLLPPGTWTTSQTLTVVRGNDAPKKVLTGNGFVSEELPERTSTAAFDVLVGLVCFERTAVDLRSLGKLHNLLGSAAFWNLFDAGAFQFYYLTDELGVAMASPDSYSGGELVRFSLSGVRDAPTSSEFIDRFLSRSLTPAPGREAVVKVLLERLRSQVRVISAGSDYQYAKIARGVLARPSVRDVLGISHATSMSKIPDWYAYPVLRVGQVVRLGHACAALRAPSVQFGLGSQVIASTVFGTLSPGESAGSLASYVAFGNFSTHGAERMLASPRFATSLMKFRDSQAGALLRSEVLRALHVEAGADAIAAINGGLAAAVPSRVTQSARDTFRQLGLPDRADSPIPAVWTDHRHERSCLALWRSRSRVILEERCRASSFGRNSCCPCGSGEPLRHCCRASLRRKGSTASD